MSKKPEDLFWTTDKKRIFNVDECFGGQYVLPLLKFRRLEALEIVNHCFTTRLGGVSEGIYSSLNLGLERGDDEKNTLINFERVAASMGVNKEKFVFSAQTHTTNVRVITQEDAGNGMTRKNEFADVDGMITNVPGIVLVTFYADCVPLYFVDPVNKAIGLSHAGWKGTVHDMAGVTVRKLTETYGTKPEDLVVAIGPSICKECYEIGNDVAREYIDEFKDDKKKILVEKPKEKYMLDLWRANKIKLKKAGVKKENIVTTNICTCCNSAVMFSHRESGGKRGNLGAFLSLL